MSTAAESAAAAANNWQPTESDLTNVIQLLENSQAPDSNTQKQVQKTLDTLNTNPEFCRYLVYVLGELTQQPVPLRALSGLLLKNTIRQKWQFLPPEIHQFLKLRCFKAIGDESPLIRATVGIIITTIFNYEGTANWKMCLPTLLDFFKIQDYNVVEGALGALQKMCEDSAERFNVVETQSILEPCIIFFGTGYPKLRSMALNITNSILMMQNEAIADYLDMFLQHLFLLGQDQDKEVQRQLCRALTLLLECHIAKIEPQLAEIAEFMLLRTQDDTIEISLEACEFWLALAEYPQECKKVLEPMLPKLFPVLLKCMRYTPEDIALMKGEGEDDANVPDRDEDIKPRFHKSKTQGGSIDACQSEDEEEDEEDGDDSTEWNLRKCAAASLDVLASAFGDTCLLHLFPILKETLACDDWIIKESAILAIGAVAEGCMTGMSPHLPELIPFLIESLNDNKAFVRSIACWTISRYCHFAVQEGQEETFKALMQQLLARILDSNKRVQEAACSAFATFEEEACQEMVPYLGEIVQTFVEAFRRYQTKNLLILYDAVGTLADSVGDKLAAPEIKNALMEPIMQKWNNLTDDDRELYPLLECVSSIAMALQKEFLPYTGHVFARCLQFMENNITKTVNAGMMANQLRQEIASSSIPTDSQLAQLRQIEAPEKDVLIVAVDLLSELTEALGQLIEPLVGSSRLMQLVFFCSNDANVEVRQSTFALLGDLAKSCYQHVQPMVHMFLPVLAANINPDQVSVCNNSIWAIGEITMKMGPGIKPFLQILFPPLLMVMVRDRPTAKTLQENCAITMGRLGVYCADEIAPHLNNFIRPWCLALRNIRDNLEKESAFYGMCLMIDRNPAGVTAHFIFLCDAIVSWQNPSETLKQMFARILYAFVGNIGPEVWGTFSNSFPSELRTRLQTQYNL